MDLSTFSTMSKVLSIDESQMKGLPMEKVIAGALIKRGITSSDVLDDFIRILFTKNTVELSKALNETSLSTIFVQAHDQVMSKTKNMGVVFTTTKRFVSERVDVSREPPKARTTKTVKWSKRMQHYAGFDVTLDVIATVLDVIGNAREEGLREALCRYVHELQKAENGVINSFKTGHIVEATQFIKDVSGDFHFMKALSTYLRQDEKAINVLKVLDKVSQSYLESTFSVAISSHGDKVLYNPLAMANFTDAAKDMCDRWVLFQSGEGSGENLDGRRGLGGDDGSRVYTNGDVEGVLVVGGKTFDSMRNHLKVVRVFVDRRMGMLAFTAQDYSHSMHGGIVYPPGEDYPRQMMNNPESNERLVQIVRCAGDGGGAGVRDINSTRGNEVFGPDNSRIMEFFALDRPGLPILVYNNSQELVNSPDKDVCKDSLTINGITVLGSTDGLNDGSSPVPSGFSGTGCCQGTGGLVKNVPSSISWKNARGTEVTVNHEGMLAYLCTPQLYDTVGLNRKLFADRACKFIHDVEDLKSTFCRSATFLPELKSGGFKGKLDDQMIKRQTPYFPSHIGSLKAMNSLNYHARQWSKHLMKEKTPFADVISTCYPSSGAISNDLSEATCKDNVHLRAYPRLCHGNIPEYMQDSDTRVNMGLNLLRGWMQKDDKLEMALKVWQESLMPEEHDYYFYIFQGLLMANYQNSRELAAAMGPCRDLTVADKNLSPIFMGCCREYMAKRNRIPICTNRMIMDAVEESFYNGDNKNVQRLVNCMKLIRTFVHKVADEYVEMRKKAQSIGDNKLSEDGDLLSKSVSWILDESQPIPYPVRAFSSNFLIRVQEMYSYTFRQFATMTEEKAPSAGGATTSRTVQAVGHYEGLRVTSAVDMIRDKVFWILMTALTGGELCLGHINPDVAAEEISKEVFPDTYKCKIEDSTPEKIKEQLKTVGVVVEKLLKDADNADTFDKYQADPSVIEWQYRKGMKAFHPGCSILVSVNKPDRLHTPDSNYVVKTAFSLSGIPCLNALCTRGDEYERFYQEAWMSFPYVSPMCTHPRVPREYFNIGNEEWREVCGNSGLDVHPDPVVYTEFHSVHRMAFLASLRTNRKRLGSATEIIASALIMHNYLTPLAHATFVPVTKSSGFAFLLIHREEVEMESCYFSRPKSILAMTKDGNVSQETNTNCVGVTLFENYQFNEITEAMSSTAFPNSTFLSILTALNFVPFDYYGTDQGSMRNDAVLSSIHGHVRTRETKRGLRKHDGHSHRQESSVSILLAPTRIPLQDFQDIYNVRGDPYYLSRMVDVCASHTEKDRMRAFYAKGDMGLTNPYSFSPVCVNAQIHNHRPGNVNLHLRTVFSDEFEEAKWNRLVMNQGSSYYIASKIASNYQDMYKKKSQGLTDDVIKDIQSGSLKNSHLNPFSMTHGRHNDLSNLTMTVQPMQSYTDPALIRDVRERPVIDNKGTSGNVYRRSTCAKKSGEYLMTGSHPWSCLL